MTARIRQVIGWGLLVLLVVWIAFNFKEVEINLLIFGTVSMPRAFVILFSAGMGAAAVYFLKFVRKRETK